MEKKCSILCCFHVKQGPTALPFFKLGLKLNFAYIDADIPEYFNIQSLGL
jgi:hypothetical protein